MQTNNTTTTQADTEPKQGEILVVCQLCGTPQIVTRELITPSTKKKFSCIGCQYHLCTMVPQDNGALHRFLLLKMNTDLPMAVAYRTLQLDVEAIPYKLQTFCDTWGVSIYTVTRVRTELIALKEKLGD